jgi:hypothetical protein
MMKKRAVNNRSDIRTTISAPDYNALMPDRPARLWKDMTPAQRLAAAEAFWIDDAEDIQTQHIEALVLLARRLNFRAKSVQALSVERRTKYLAQMNEVSDAVATRALIAYHFRAHRPLMAAFLDGVGITHDNGLITQEDVAPPDADRLAAAVAATREAFPAEDVTFYLRTLVTLDGETWVNLEGLLPAKD